MNKTNVMSICKDFRKSHDNLRYNISLVIVRNTTVYGILISIIKQYTKESHGSQ